MAFERDSPLEIPKWIHHIWFDFGQGKHISAKFKPMVQSWYIHHPAWKHTVWNEKEAEELIVRDYPHYKKLYLSFPHKIQQVDFFKYILMHAYGGIYVDTDMVCNRPIDSLIFNLSWRCRKLLWNSTPNTRNKVAWVPLSSSFQGVTNSILMGEPGHAFWGVLLDSIGKTKIKFPFSLSTYCRVMFSTGPNRVTCVVDQYVGNNKNKVNLNNRDVLLLLPSQHFFDKTNTRAYGFHDSGMTWIKSEQKVCIVLISMVLGVVLATFMVRQLFRRTFTTGKKTLVQLPHDKRGILQHSCSD